MITSLTRKWLVILMTVSIVSHTAAVTVADESQDRLTAQDEPQATAPVPPSSEDRPAPEITSIPPWSDEEMLDDGSTTYPDEVIDEALGPIREEKFWFRADYLQWWTKGTRLPPLITTSPVGTPPAQAGVLGQPQTNVLYGGEYINNDSRSGVRFSTGVWLDACQTVAFVADYFDLAGGSAPYYAASNGSSILARPFYNVQTGQQASQIIDDGSLNILDRDYFQSFGGQLLFNLLSADCCEDDCGDSCGGGIHRWGYQVGFLAGYRYYRLDDSLSIRENLTSITPPFTGATFDITDGFRTENEFNGAEIGFRTRVYRNRWSIGLLTKMAIGNNRQVVTIDGQTITTLPGLSPITSEGGLLTTGTNIGRYTDDQFTVIPQLGLEVGYDLTDSLRLLAGYDLIYWPHVQRAAGQIDMAIDPRNLPPAQPGGTIFPQPQLVSEDFWAQGFNVGVEFRY